MAKLIYRAVMSLDGYAADKNGNFDWAQPAEEFAPLVNEIRNRGASYAGG